MHNRVDAVGDGRSALSRWRIKQIRTESGGDVIISYSPVSDCDRDHLPQPDSNTTRCMPSYYSPGGTIETTIDWFHKYVVTRIDQNDLVTDQPSTTTFYDYLGEPAWHYQDDEITKDKYKTWGDWRGYAKVRVRTGLTTGEQSSVEYHYLRGMNGDKLSDGTTRTVSVSDWGGTVVDHEALNGFLRQEIRYTGATSTGPGAEASATVNQPWTHGPTATRTRNGVTTSAYMTHTRESRTRTALAAGGYRYRTATSTFNDDGYAVSVSDTGDEGISDDDTCIRNTYARNPDNWMLDKVVMTEKLKGSCATAPAVGTPTQTIQRTRNFYDDATVFGTSPTKGDLVRIEFLDSWTTGGNPTYVAQTNTYDTVGRPKSVTDVRGYTTTTDYTTVNGGLVTQTVVTNPLLQKLTTNTEPAWAAPTTITDANNITTTLRYDASGRLTTVWLPGRATSAPADSKYTYTLRQADGPSSVISEELLPNGTSYKKSVKLFDGFLRERQEQTQATGGGRVLTDTFYNTRGDLDWISAPYYDSTNTAVGTTLGVPQGQIPAITQTVRDGLGRVTAKIFLANGVEQWRTTASYGGDRDSVTPPSGGTATTALVDIFGRTTSLRQYKNRADVGSDDTTKFDAVTYKYDVAGRLTTQTDAANNTWTYNYDVRGRPTVVKDPDHGTTTTTYDAGSNVQTVTDNIGQVLAYTYDALGRKTSVRDGSVTGPKRAEWTYDTLPNGIGRPTKSIRWIGTTAYENRINTYDTSGRPTSTSVVLPATVGALCASEPTAPCTYTSTASYKPNGALATTVVPQAGGLSKESLTYGYNDIGEQTTLISASQIYVQTATYDKLGMLTGRTLGNTGSRVAITSSYDEPTRRLRTTNVVPEAKPEAVNYGYDYDPAGNVTKITDTAQGQTPDIQCFGYDYRGRLTTARTASTNDCTIAPSLSNLGSSAPYWRAWQYDTTSNRTKETRYATTNTVIGYTYPTPGATAVRPHAVTGTTTTTGTQVTTRGYTYDDLGNVKTRTADSGNLQTLTWDKEGHLDTLTEASKTTSHVYDADGNRLIRTTPTGKTLYLPDGTEVALPTGATTATGTRYYSHKSTLIATRTSAGLTWIIGNHVGTAELTVAASGLAVTKRRTLPFGELRTNPTGWPTTLDKGFVGGTTDPSGLTHLGAREYDPALGRFISVDPVMDIGDPDSWNGYAYADNSPVTKSDPDGRMCKMDDGSPCGPAKRQSPPKNEGSGGGNSGGSKQPAGTAGVDYTEDNSYVCVSGYFCMDQYQVPKPREYYWAYNDELAKLRARNHGGDLADHQIAQAMINACGMDKLRNCTQNTYNALQLLWSAKAVAAKEAAEGVDNKKVAVAAAFAVVEAAAGAPACVLKGVVGGRRSFSGDTPVLLADGRRKKLKDIRPGDNVIATDPETGEEGPRTVTTVWVHDDDLYTLVINGRQLTTTEDHPFWNATDHRWQPADELDRGNLLHTPDGRYAAVSSFAYTTHHVAPAYNLTIDGIHTYYVLAGNTPVLVHNENGGLGDNINLYGDYTARMDQFNVRGQASFEVHVYYRGSEVGIYGSNGFFNKHGINASNISVPDQVKNRLKGIAVDQMRKIGQLGPNDAVKGDAWKRPMIGTEGGC